MLQARVGAAQVDEFVEFRATGDRVEGAHRCAECSYGVAVFDVLPRCPMCGGESWEPSDVRPYVTSTEPRPTPTP